MKNYLLTSLSFFLFFTSVAQIKAIVPDKNIQMVKEPARTVAFRLSAFSGLTLSSSGNTALNVSVKEFDLANNTRGNAFTAPENGVYHFDVHLNFNFAISDYTNYLRFHLSLLRGSDIIEKTTMMNAQTAYSPEHSLALSTTVALSKGDVITAVFATDANPGTAAINGTAAYFSGFKVADISGVQTDRIR